MERCNGAIKTTFDIQVDGKRGPGRPNMTCKQLIERDCREWKLSAIGHHNRDTWRSVVRSAMPCSKPATRKRPTVVDVTPVPALTKNPVMMMMMMNKRFSADGQNITQSKTIMRPMVIMKFWTALSTRRTAATDSFLGKSRLQWQHLSGRVDNILNIRNNAPLIYWPKEVKPID